MRTSPFACAILVAFSVGAARAQQTLQRFDRIELSDVYYSEGANAADLDNDGHVDAIYGPNWFAGPDFKSARPIYKVTSPSRANAMRTTSSRWPYDFDGDGWVDVFTVGFPGTPAHVYQNPGRDGHGAPWPKHQVFDWVSNESPHFTDLVGDDRPELICTRDGFSATRRSTGRCRSPPGASTKFHHRSPRRGSGTGWGWGTSTAMGARCDRQGWLV